MSSPVWGAVPQRDPKSEILDLNFGHSTTNISKTVSRSVTYQLELNQLDESLLKCKSRGSSPLKSFKSEICPPHMAGIVLLTQLFLNLLFVRNAVLKNTIYH